MARAKDRTEDWKDAVRRAAIYLEYDEAKLASIMASFIIHKPRRHSPFMKAALNTLESIGTLEQFIMKHAKDYMDHHRMTVQERDNVEHEVTLFVKTCKEHIDILKDSINSPAHVKSWIGSREDGENADTVAHKHGVVLISSEKLHAVSSRFDQMRMARFQETVDKLKPRRRAARASRTRSTTSSRTFSAEFNEPERVQPEPSTSQQMLLDDETRALQVELTGLLDTVQVTETKMVEMSALNHLISTHVLQQAQQIEQLYEQAIEATKNVELGNRELSKAIERNKGSRTFLLLFLFVLTFSVLFLDWYS